MKSFRKEIIMSLLLYVLGILGLGLLDHYGITEGNMFDFIYNILLYNLPIVIFVVYYALRIQRQMEILRRNNIVTGNYTIENWTHILAMLESDKELWSKLSHNNELKKELLISWKFQYERKLKRELCKLYPKKTQPQIDKMLKDFLTIDDETN